MNYKIKVINGPNINMLGIREKNIYGNKSYEDLCDMMKEKADQLEIDIDFFQSNHEGAIVDCIQVCYKKYDGIIINPAAYTHYSIAILDAIKTVLIPTVEVHLSDITKREDFRKHSVTKDACIAQVYGKGMDGYITALQILLKNFKKTIDK